MTQWNEPTQRMPVSGPPGPQRDRRHDPAANPFGAEGNEVFGIAGTVLGLLGGVVLVVSFTALEWFRGQSFGDVRDLLDTASGTGFATAYFSWFAWTFAVVAVLAAVLTSFPSPALRALRIVGVFAGVAAAGLTFLAVQLTDGTPYTEYLKLTRVGFYAAIVGFLLAGIGAGIGPRRV